jgi:Polyketide cyclase / dehydrase and lipid transport
MAAQQIDVEVHTSGDAASVYARLRDGASWPIWSPIASFELDRPGPDGDEGVGARRFFRTRTLGRTTVSHEEIVELWADRRFSYALLSGLPLRGYRADVDLEPDDTGTVIRWHSSFDAKVPGTGWFYRRMLESFIQRCAAGLAAAADRADVRP